MNKSDQTQHDKFKEAAKELGCDESEARFEGTLKKITKPSDKQGNQSTIKS